MGHLSDFNVSYNISVNLAETQRICILLSNFNGSRGDYIHVSNFHFVELDLIS